MSALLSQIRLNAAIMGDDFALTDIERECGVHLELVRPVARDTLAQERDGELVAVVTADFGPATAMAAARLRLNAPVEYRGMNYAGLLVYVAVPARAQDGVSRCDCGAKYWINDVCVDCGTPLHRVLREQAF